MQHIFLYGPPGSGKTTVGRILAEALQLPLKDLDSEIEARQGLTITEIMKTRGETAFRDLESAALEKAAQNDTSVISLGGGALLRDTNRSCAESAGVVVVLEADLETLTSRLSSGWDSRPLLAGDLEERLGKIMEERRSHYNSFKIRIANENRDPAITSREIQTILGRFRLHQGQNGYDILIQRNSFKQIGELLKGKSILNLVGIVMDSNVAPYYGESLRDLLRDANIDTRLITIPAGEKYKTLETVSRLWQEFLLAGLDRKSVVIALGGGVTGDLTGFAASTFMRGISWIGIPTSLLSMVDASIGGKTGFDLPYGKNLVGAFHSPIMVVSDPDLLSTLPEAEFRSGMAEVVKHGVIADPQLFEICSKCKNAYAENLVDVVRRAVAVKVEYILTDPFEYGIRAALNYGHTVGHAVELVSGFQIRHGEAVAIGMVSEARLAERLSLAHKGLAEEITQRLADLGLPTGIPSSLSKDEVLHIMQIDKKKVAGKVRFSLPTRIGEVKTGIEIDDLNLVFMEG